MKNLITFLSMVVVFAGCDKDKTEPNTPPPVSPLETKRNLLMNAKWELTKRETVVILNSGDTVTFDITPTPNCTSDDLLEYHSSGFIKTHTGFNICYTGQSPVDTLKAWAMDNEHQIMETHLHNNFNQYWDIEVLDEQTLRISTGEVDTNGNQHNISTYTNAL